MWLLLALLAGLCTWVISAALYALLRKYQILDIPNTRSSHNLPTPKGGGIGLIAVICIYAGWLAISGAAPFPLLAIALATLALSLLGLVDDLRNLAVRLRFGVQIGLTLVVVALTVWPADLPLPMRLALAGLAALFLLWCTNLYNFMDGIDGIACLQAILCGALIYGLHFAGLYPGQLADLALVVAICCLGFGYFNFPPAKMFMGDAGSVALGFLLAGMALLEYNTHPTAFWLWLIALAGFISDASATLTVRFFSGHRVYEAHRSHLYQLYTQHCQNRLLAQGMELDTARVGAHRATLIAFGGIFLLWQAPIGIAVAGNWLPGPLGACVALVPLTLIAVYLGAGRERIRLESLFSVSRARAKRWRK